MKEKYTAPEMEIIEFEAEDVIATSLTDGGTAPDFGEGGDEIDFTPQTPLS